MTNNNNLDWWNDLLSSEGKNAEEIEYQKNTIRIKSKIELTGEIFLKIKTLWIKYPDKHLTAHFKDKKSFDELAKQHRLFDKKVKFKFDKVNKFDKGGMGMKFQCLSNGGWRLYFQGELPDFKFHGGEMQTKKVFGVSFGESKYNPVFWEFKTRASQLIVEICNERDSDNSQIWLYLDHYPPSGGKVGYEIVDINKELAQQFFDIAQEINPKFSPTMESFYAYPTEDKDGLGQLGKKLTICRGD